MLAYQNIHAVAEAQSRLSSNNYRWQIEHTAEADRLTVFTFGAQAVKDSEDNLKLCLEQGRQHHARLLIMHPFKIQYLGQSDTGHLADSMFSKAWCEDYSLWLRNNNDVVYRSEVEQSDRGEVLKFDAHRRCMVVQHSHYGIYDITTGERIKNRRDIIQRIWDHGFASWRGRPLTVARLRWSGTRKEITELTELADRYWSRRGKSDVASKIVSAYTSINRYAAWPGAW